PRWASKSGGGPDCRRARAAEHGRAWHARDTSTLVARIAGRAAVHPPPGVVGLAILVAGGPGAGRSGKEPLLLAQRQLLLEGRLPVGGSRLSRRGRGRRGGGDVHRLDDVDGGDALEA